MLLYIITNNIERIGFTANSKVYYSKQLETKKNIQNSLRGLRCNNDIYVNIKQDHCQPRLSLLINTERLRSQVLKFTFTFFLNIGREIFAIVPGKLITSLLFGSVNYLNEIR